MKEPSKKAKVPKDRREFLRSGLSTTISSFPRPSFTHLERPATLKEFAAAEGISVGGGP